MNAIICFGQQPSGIFPKRFLYAKIQTARRLQAQIGGEIVFFYHDSDHDPRETRTLLRHRKTQQPFALNFAFANKLQRKYSPMHLKRVLPQWHEKTALQLPELVDRHLVEAFQNCHGRNVADFCLEMHGQMGLLDGIRIARSSDPAFRQSACDIDDFFVEVPYQNEIVRARWTGGALRLHRGGESYLTLPAMPFIKSQTSPSRDSRLRWMQSVIHCTHYVCGVGEQNYLHEQDAPEIKFVKRDTIDRSDEAWTL